MMFLKNLSDIDNVNVLHRLLDTIGRYPKANWEDALSKGQITSKIWMINELSNLDIKPKVTYCLASWYGLTSLMLSEYLNYDSVKCFDIDPDTIDICDRMVFHRLLNEWKYKAIEKNMFDIDYQSHCYTMKRGNDQIKVVNESTDLIINCSCEHVDYKHWLTLIPKNKTVVLQNNNGFDLDAHVSCVDSLDAFEDQCNLNEIWFSGEVQLAKFKRFMIIGKT